MLSFLVDVCVLKWDSWLIGLFNFVKVLVYFLVMIKSLKWFVKWGFVLFFLVSGDILIGWLKIKVGWIKVFLINFLKKVLMMWLIVVKCFLSGIFFFCVKVCVFLRVIFF